MNIPKNKSIDIKEIAKMYKAQYNEELPDIVDRYGYIHEMPQNKAATATKPQNEVKKLNNLLNEVNYLANMEKPEPSKYADMPKTFIDDYNERRKKNSEEQK